MIIFVPCNHLPAATLGIMARQSAQNMREIRFFMAACLLLMVGAVQAQQLSLTGNRTSFGPDERITISYSGAEKGDRIVLYHNISLMPLRQACEVVAGSGSFVPSGLQPGDYRALLVGADGEGKVQIFFNIGDHPLPAGKRIVVIADPHVMSPDLVEDPTNERYQYVMSQDRKLMPESFELFSAVLDSVRALKPDLFFIVGDMTKDGELASHEMVVAYLQQLANEGIRVLVIPGNHDMENISSYAFTASGLKKTDNVSIDEFVALYQEFGWGLDSERDPYSLTYACDIFDGVRLIGIDDCRTTSRGYPKVGDAEYGSVNPETIDWVLAQADKAVADGKVVIAAIHHQLLQHYVGQERLMASAATEHGDSIARLLADHGVRVVLTGHMHTPNISRIKGFETDGVITEIACPSTVTYPVQYRVLTLSDDLATLSADVRYLRRTANLPDVQQTARDKVESTLGKTIYDLVPRYMYAFNQMLASFASDPAFAAVLDDVPKDPEELAALAEQAFSETLKKVIFTFYEGNEHLKSAEEDIFGQLKTDCATACELVFEQQTPDTRAFLAMTLYYYVLENAETMLHSMLSDTSNWGTELADQTDDFYVNIALRGADAGIAVSRAKDNTTLQVYSPDGIRMGSDLKNLPRGLYIVRQGASSNKIVVR